MKYYVNGQKKEPFFMKRKNRVIALAIACVPYAIYAIMAVDFLWALTESIWIFIVYLIVEVYMLYSPKSDFVTSLEITNKEIRVESFYGRQSQIIPIENIKKIEKTLTEFSVHKKDGNGITIPITIFSYNDIQSIKADLEEIITKLEHSESPSYV